MVGFTCLVAAFAMGASQNQASLLSRLFPIPSGKNGYEEYVMACDIADRNLFSVYDTWLGYLMNKPKEVDPRVDPEAPQMPPDVTPDMRDLEVRKLMDERFGKAVHFMAEGNRKPVTNPHQVFNMETPFPELAPFKVLAKVDINRAHVEFADGRSAAAVKDLIEGLRFSHNIFGTTRVSSLVAVATQAVVLSEFNQELSQLSLDDARDIEKACKSLLSLPLPISDIVKRECDAEIADLDKLLDNPALLFYQDDEKAKADFFKNVSPADREQIKSLVAQSLSAKAADEVARYDGPESGWLDRDLSAEPTFSMNDHSASNLAAVLSDSLMGKGLMRQYSTALAKTRIQLRLLRLHAQIIEFKWLHGRLPKDLAECATDGADFDPMVGDRFHYERTDGGYRLYSQGVPGLGRIELKYRVQVGSTPGGSGPRPPV